jgi:hypothetical protein
MPADEPLSFEESFADIGARETYLKTLNASEIAAADAPAPADD